MPAKKVPNRTAKASLLLRCSPEDKAVVEEAVAVVQEGLPEGATMTVNAFILTATMKEARRVLAEKRPPGWSKSYAIESVADELRRKGR